MRLRRLALTAIFAAGLAGCQSAPIQGIRGMFQGSPGAEDLASGLKQYEDGNYAEATRLLQSSLDQGLSSTSDQVNAYKHLAFIHCVSGRETRCRDEFRNALKVDPSFELEANEVGHPIWGPVFRRAKGRR